MRYFGSKFYVYFDLQYLQSINNKIAPPIENIQQKKTQHVRNIEIKIN